MTALTFPGPILRQVIVQLGCRWRRLAVLNIRYLQLTSPFGYVLYEPPPDASGKLVLYNLALIGGLTIGAVFGAVGSLGFISFDLDAIDFVLAWLGFSFAAHAFPSYAEARALWVDTNWRAIPSARRALWLVAAALSYFGSVWEARWIIAALLPALVGLLFNLIAGN